MKKYIALLIFVMALPTAALAQVRTSYFMEGSTFRTDMNPALAPTRGYVNFPLLGGLNVGLNNNFLSIENMLYPTNDGRLVTFMHQSVDRNKFLKRLPNNNTLGLSLSEQIIGFGAHGKRFFWSFGLNLKANADVNIPKQFFSLITNLGQGSYNMQNMHVGLNTYMEAYLGAAIPVKDIATVGFRVKGLWGIASANLNVNTLNANITDQEVSAQFAGELEGSFPVANSNLPTGEPVNPNEIVDPNFDGLGSLDFNKLKNGGIAVDLGAEVRLVDDKLRLSAAITDLGFIHWNKSATVAGNMGTSFRYSGIDLSTGEAQLENEEFEFIGAGSGKGATTRLNCALNFGAEYAILNNHISFGVLSHTQFCKTFNHSELTASVNFKPVNWLTATISHTFLNHNQPGVFGFALNLHPKGLNLFVGADFIDLKFAKAGGKFKIPVRQRSVNLNFGLGFSLGRAKYLNNN
ncbi:MAG: hypothetical protein II307_03215 [Alistipes sp.]|nr:hypothetical protein [Alistipes sp.]